MKKSAMFIAFLLILTSLAPTVSAAAAPVRTETFIPEAHVYLGWPGYTPLAVSGDGSFSLAEETVHFGYTTKIAQITRSTPYPATVHTFSDGNLFYNVQIFVNERVIGDVPCLVLYARLTVENLLEDTVAFPAVSQPLTALTDLPDTLSPENKIVCDYALILDAGENELPAYEKEMLGTFDENKTEMEEYWKKQLSGSFSFTKVPEEAASFANSLQTGYVDLLCEIPSEAEQPALAAFLKKLPADVSSMTCFDAAVYFMKTADTSFLDSVWEQLQNRYNQIDDMLENYAFTASEQEEKVRLLPGANQDTALMENLDALAELKAFAYLCRTMAPEKEGEAQAAYQNLLSSVETVMRNTVSYCTSHWSVTDISGSLSQGIFTLSSDSSAAAAVKWYRKDALFTAPGGGTYLKRLARQQFPYPDVNALSDPFSFADAVVSQPEDGTIILGQGIPGVWLGEETTLSFKNYPLQDGGALDCTITCEKKEIQIKLSPTTPTAASLEFPVFLNNIEYASCGFDSENGIVSVPAGITEITVRLKQDVETITQAFQSERDLEAAISAYEGIHLSEYTKYSVSLFSPALENAKAARTGPAAEMHKAAAELQKAAARLARTQSSYTLSLYEDDSAPVGYLEADEICQAFTSVKAGTLSKIFLEGSFAEGITAMIYSLQKDGFSPGDLLEEVRGTAAEKGILFEPSVEVEADTGYLLCLYSENGDFALPVYQKSQDVQILYNKAGEDIIAYDLTCIGVSFHISQANLEDLDTFLEKCMNTDMSSYTKESRNRLETEMKAARELLCTQSVSKDEYQSVYTDLKDAYAALNTYPSDAPLEETPAALYVVLGVAIVLLVAGGVGAVASYKKREW